MNSLKEYIETLDKIRTYVNIDDNIICVSIGCDLNHLEGEKVRTLLKSINPEIKVILINTCIAYDYFDELTDKIINYIKDNYINDYKLYLIGCGSDYFKDKYPSITAIPHNKQFDVNEYNIPKISNKQLEDKKLGLIQIQNGCNNQCSYCLFPTLRGHKSISKTKEDICKEIDKTIKSGLKQITLTGVNICQYEDPNTKENLIDLLKYIVATNVELHKIEIYSIDPAYDKIFELIDYIKQEDKLSKNLYLAAQSGSDAVIKRMNRHHSKQRLLDIINYSKDINLRYDFIIGHPGETDLDFEESMNILRLSQTNDIVGGLAKFTAHPKTASYYMEDKVPKDIIDKRYNKIEALTNKIIALIKQPIKCIQFEVWQNCEHPCKFCYLNGSRIIYNEIEKQQAILKTIDIINSEKIKDYNAIGLIGGELFGEQLKDSKTLNDFIDLIKYIKQRLNEDSIKEVWLTSALLTDNLDSLIKTLEILTNNLPKYQRILLCTSYDTVDRFHNEQEYKLWYNNLLKLKDMFPNLTIHIQIISTQYLIDEWLDNTDKFLDFKDKGFLIDFKPPTINIKDFIDKVTDLASYRECLLDMAKRQSPDYLITSRNRFLKFIRSVIDIFGVDKAYDFVDNHVKSECCYSLPEDKWFMDRWYNTKENAQCGHCWDGYCYKDEPNICCKCDVEKLIKYYKE